WEERLYKHWPGVFVGRAQAPARVEGLRPGQGLEVSVPVVLGALEPSDVTVELYYGFLDVEGHLRDGIAEPLEFSGETFEEAYVFKGKVIAEKVGQYGFAVRVLPNVSKMKKKFEPGLITWG
ncbi:MAG: alpha-glucan phosphorylase, partial [Planctomycetota bacterium]